ncbi:unnamed protein product, partial [Prunus brigantina]
FLLFIFSVTLSDSSTPHLSLTHARKKSTPTPFLSRSETNPNLIGRLPSLLLALSVSVSLSIRLYRARSLALSLLVTSLSLSRDSFSLSEHHPISLVFGTNPCKLWRALVHSELLCLVSVGLD